MFDPTSDFQNQNLGLTSTLPYNNQSFGDLQDLMTDFVNHSSLVGETTQQYLITALQEAQIILQNFAQSSTKDEILGEAFGVNYHQENADILLNNIAQNNFNGTPEIKVIDSDILVNANGAYSHKINTIFLADEFVKNSDSQAIIGVILEEFGHYIDSLINIKTLPEMKVIYFQD